MNPIKILLVDDSKSARYALRLQLQRHETLVETADSAEAGLERIKTDPPDAVFMDHTMPGMNGLEALDYLKADPATAGIPVVMCTSNEDAEYLEQARRKGALDVLAKSSAKDRLPSLLAQINGIISGLPSAVQHAPSAPPAMDMGAVSKLIHQEVPQLIETSINSVLEQRMEAALVPMLTEFGDRLTSDINAQVQLQVAERIGKEAPLLIEERIEHAIQPRVEALVNPMLADLANRLTTDIQDQIQARLDERLGPELQRVQDQMAQAQEAHARASIEKISGEILPRIFSEQFEKERNGLAQMAQEMIDSRLDNIGEESDLMRQLLSSADSNLVARAEEAARRHAQTVAEQTSREQAQAVAEGFLRASKSNTGTQYLLTALAALAGIGASALVYFLLS